MNVSEKKPKTTLKRQIGDNFEIVKEKQRNLAFGIWFACFSSLTTS